ncbi:amino acid ABC transporter permease [Tessaracoccus lubricantis]|uniref:Amino acid ABC transporter permease n=1 Tax=Tessaracoccus lubricantis TaxID=545543 RepID=A0ABP9FDR9_9ACTN
MSTTAALFDAPGPRTRRRHLIYAVVGALIIFGIAGWVLVTLWDAGQITLNRWAPVFTAEAWVQYFLPGIRQTVVAAAISMALAFVFGLMFAMGRMSELAPLRWVSAVVVEFFRAVPVLIMMLFVFYLLTYNTDITGPSLSFTAVVVGLTAYNGAVIAEVVRNGVASLPAGQREAGLSIGLTSSQTRRMILVPQALTAMMPTLVSQLVVVLKDTALGYIILYPELLNRVRQMGNRFGNLTVTFVVGALLFIALNLVVTSFAQQLEKRLKRRGKTAGPITEAEPADRVLSTQEGAVP